MQTHRRTLELLVREIAPDLIGGILIDAFSSHFDELVLSFEESGRRKSLCVSCTPNSNAIYLREEVPHPRRNSVRFFHSLFGTPIADAALHPSDRVILVKFPNGEDIAIALLGAQANVVRRDGSGIVAEAFKKPRSVQGELLPIREEKSRTELSPEQFAEPARQTTFTLVQALKNQFGHLGNLLIREVIFRSGVDGTRHCRDLLPDEWKIVARSAADIANELESPQPRVYLEKGVPVRFSIIPLSQFAHCEAREFDTVNAAVRFFVTRSRGAADFESSRRQIGSRLKSEELRLASTIEKVSEELAQSSRAREYEKYGVLLKAHLPEIPLHAVSVTLTDDFSSPDEPPASVTIPLEPNLTAAQNADRWFEKARSARVRRREQAERLPCLRALFDKVREALEKLSAVNDAGGLKEYQHATRPLVTARTAQRSGEPGLPYRRFVVTGNYEVLVGKSSKDNDELTTKAAKPHDYWLHARGVSGSHVVLKVKRKGEKPPKEALREAAQIAAYYSKAKTSSLAPVIVTERKYVHKKKGSPAGQVVVDREEVLLVKPRRPVGDGAGSEP